MPINTNLTTIPAKSIVLPFGADINCNDSGASISFDSGGNVTLKLPIILGDNCKWYENAGKDMPSNAVAISHNPTPSVTVNGAVINLSMSNGSLKVALNFMINGDDAGKQKNPTLEGV